MSDPSTSFQREAFARAVTGGGTVAAQSCASAVAASTTPMPATVSTLLNLPDGATFAQGAAVVASGIV